MKPRSAVLRLLDFVEPVKAKLVGSVPVGAWIKLKLHLGQEFVIGGYTDTEGGRKYFGSLLVGFTKARA